jgi:hypothetical protein
VVSQVWRQNKMNVYDLSGAMTVARKWAVNANDKEMMNAHEALRVLREPPPIMRHSSRPSWFNQSDAKVLVLQRRNQRLNDGLQRLQNQMRAELKLD